MVKLNFTSLVYSCKILGISIYQPVYSVSIFKKGFTMAYVLNGIATVLSLIFNLILLLVFAQVILSWVGDPENNIVRSINKIANPLYRPFQKATKKISSSIDFAPFIVIAIVVFLQASLIPFLRSFS